MAKATPARSERIAHSRTSPGVAGGGRYALCSKKFTSRTHTQMKLKRNAATALPVTAT